MVQVPNQLTKYFRVSFNLPVVLFSRWKMKREVWNTYVTVALKEFSFFLPNVSKMARTVFDLPLGFFLSHIEVQRQAVSFASINFLLLNFVLTTQPLTSDFYN